MDIPKLTSNFTVEDILTIKKTDIQLYLKSRKLKTSGSKLELSTRAFGHVRQHGLSCDDLTTETGSIDIYTSSTAPDINELSSG